MTKRVENKTRFERPWTPEEDRILRELIQHGVSQRRAADRLGRSPGSVSSRLYRIGLRSKCGRGGNQVVAKEKTRIEVELARVASSRDVPFLATSKLQCMAVVEGDGASAVCCGAPVSYRLYCEEHARRFYIVKRRPLSAEKQRELHRLLVAA